MNISLLQRNIKTIVYQCSDKTPVKRNNAMCKKLLSDFRQHAHLCTLCALHANDMLRMGIFYL